MKAGGEKLPAFFHLLAHRDIAPLLDPKGPPLALPVFSSLPPFHHATPGGGLDVTVSAGGYALLPDGDYGNVAWDSPGAATGLPSSSAAASPSRPVKRSNRVKRSSGSSHVSASPVLCSATNRR